MIPQKHFAFRMFSAGNARHSIVKLSVGDVVRLILGSSTVLRPRWEALNFPPPGCLKGAQ